MSPLDNILTGLDDLQQKLPALAKDIVSSPGFRYVMLNLNRSQMDKGLDSEGQYITLDGSPDYSPYTIMIKNEKGQPTDRITLRDTGQFYDNLKAEPEDEGINIYDTDIKSFEIEERTGKVIYGLTEENKEEIIGLLHPAIDGELKNNIIPNLLTR